MGEEAIKLSNIRAELQRLIGESFGEVLPVLPDDVPILDLGVNSLALVDGMRKVYERFGVLVSIRRMIEGQVTLGGLALYIEQELRSQNSIKKHALAARQWQVQRSIPVSPEQQHIAFLYRYSSEAAAAFNEATVIQLQGELHAPALQAALEEAGSRYEALRTALDPEQDTLNIGETANLELLVSPVQPDELQARLTEIVARPFEPGKPLFRAELLRLADDNHYLALVGHALLLDQPALARVLDEIARLYGVFSRDEAAPAAPAHLQWADYLALGNTVEAQTARQTSQAYWQQKHARSAPPLELPADQPRPAVKKYGGAKLARPLQTGTQRKLESWSAARGIRVENTLLAAFALFVQRLAASDELTIGVESDEQFIDTGLPTIARTRSTLPLRLKFDHGLSFTEFAGSVQHSVNEANQHRQLSFTRLINDLQLPRDQGRSPLFSVAFRAASLSAAPDFAGLHSAPLNGISAGARYDLELTALGSAQLVCEYSSELFEEASIARWLEDLLTMLDGAMQDGEQSCASLPLMTASEQELVLRQWNDTDRLFPRDRTVLDFILEQSGLRPEKNALRFGDKTINYRQLHNRVTELAGALRANDTGPGMPVGVLLRRSLDLVPALLSVWQVGAICVPLDGWFPPARLAFMLADTGAQTVLTQRELLPLLEGIPGVKAILVETVLSAATPPVEETSHGANLSAQILFTSGSTGRPKGVEVRHASLLNCLLSVREQLNFGPENCMLALTTPTFDISAVELFMPLMCGGQVEVGEDGLTADGLQISERIEKRHPSHLQMTPSTAKSLLAAGWRGDPQICLLSAGESLPRSLAEEMLKKSGQLWNLYGPTETTVYSVVHQVTSAPGKPMRIGRPLANTRLYVLDAHRQPLPIGAIGELYIGGEGVSPGYWNRAELSVERFLADPFRPGERIYRTGDLARYLPNGELVCLGRSDEQVKVHGVRIEPGEIETALLELPGVRDAVVTTWKDAHEDIQLVAHVIAAAGQQPSASQLRELLREKLPGVMVPPYILFSSSFPLTANGKVQRSALPVPGTPIQAQDPARLEPPASETERALQAAWARVLGIPAGQIGRNSDFMNLGGHSLLMTRLMVEVRKQFQVSFNLREFFGASTLGQFAALIEGLTSKIRQAQPDNPGTRAHSAEWARDRMGFLSREAELPQYIAPARGLSYRSGEPMRKVFMTGATGFLGAYIVSEILRTTQAELYCLVRPRRGEDGKLRIENQMRHYEVWGQDEAWQAAWQARMHVVEGDVTLPRMGLANAAYETLARDIDAIFNGAAHVNFIYPYEALRATNVLGLHEIIQFAFHTRIKPVHHLSTAAIWPMGAQYTFREKDPIDHNKLLNLGYDEAKWVGEKVLLHAAERGLPVARYRPGEVGGDSVTGHCVTDHFLIACVKGFLQFGAFPQLDIEVDVAPVDYVARAMVHLAFKRQPLGRAFHLTNPSRRTMRDALGFLRGLGYQFDELPFEVLRDRLVSSPGFASNALFAYQAALEDMNDISMQLPSYDTHETLRELQGSDIVCAPADEKLFSTYLNYLRDCGFMPAPTTLTAWEGAHA